MKSALFFCAVVVGIVGASTTVMAGPHWAEPKPDLGDDVLARCPADTKSVAEATAIDEWALQCDVVAPRFRMTFFKDFDENGDVVSRANPLYPTFGGSDPSAHYLPIWQPDLSKDANGVYTNCAIPSNVIWVSTCASQ